MESPFLDPEIVRMAASHERLHEEFAAACDLWDCGDGPPAALLLCDRIAGKQDRLNAVLAWFVVRQTYAAQGRELTAGNPTIQPSTRIA